MTQALRLLLVLCLAVAGLSVAAKPAAANTTYYLPYPAGTSYQVTQGPGGSTSHYSGTNSVQAIDFGLSAGNAISASAPGTLFKREYHPQLGNMVWLQHSDGYCTLYAHMSSFSSSINGMSVGSSSVSQGAVLGYAGTTGTSTGVHLHFGRVICSGFQTVNVDFAEVANPTEGNSYTSQNGSGGSPNGVSTYYTVSYLNSGDTLLKNRYIASHNNYYGLFMQGDGNLVMYGPGGTTIWTSQTNGDNHVTMESNGNLVIYDNYQNVKWTSGTGWAGPSRLKVGEDGNLSIVRISDGQTVWQNGPVSTPVASYNGSDLLPSGQSLALNKYLRSSDGRYNLQVMSNGHLVLYGPLYTVIWDSGYSGGGAANLVMQGDGNLVLYGAGYVAWAAASGGGTSYMKVQNDGKFVVYRNSGTAIWQSGTGIQCPSASIC